MAKHSPTNDWDTNAVWVDARRAMTVTQERHTEPQDKTLKCPPFSMARVAMTGTAAADPAADGAGAQAPATVVPPGMRSGRWNSSNRAQLEDAVMVARLAGASQVRLVLPGYATIEIDLKHEKAAGDREPVQAAERSFAPRRRRTWFVELPQMSRQS